MMNTKAGFKIFVTAIAMIFAMTIGVYSLPEIDEVVSGNVEIESDDTSMIINASDPKSIINFSSFDIQENESVQVNLPSTQAEILSRVIQNNPSDIFGSLDCNGVFILVNESEYLSDQPRGLMPEV